MEAVLVPKKWTTVLNMDSMEPDLPSYVETNNFQ